MSLRVVLVEGPDDVNALREIAQRHLGAAKAKPSAQRLPPGVAVFDTRGGRSLEVHPVTNAKSALAATFASRLRARVPTAPDDPTHLTHLAIFYDPDADQPPNQLALDAKRAIDADPQGWQLAALGAPPVDAWTAHRSPDERVDLRVIPWLAPGPTVGGLVDGQNLDRLLSHVAALAYPSETARLDAWLVEIHQRRKALTGLKTPKWKAATLLWAALIDDQAVTDAGIHARFFGQHGACVPHVRAALEATHLWNELTSLFA